MVANGKGDVCNFVVSNAILHIEGDYDLETEIVVEKASSEVAPQENWEWTLPKMTAVTLLLEGKKVKEVAALVGVSESAIYDWKKKKAFLEALQFARDETRLRIQDKLASAMEEALDKTVELMRTGNNRQRVQLDAAGHFMKLMPNLFKNDEKDGVQGNEVKIIVVNNTTIESRKKELQTWEQSMGYDEIEPDKLNNLRT